MKDCGTYEKELIKKIYVGLLQAGFLVTTG